jgi:hypothetical protein
MLKIIQHKTTTTMVDQKKEKLFIFLLEISYFEYRKSEVKTKKRTQSVPLSKNDSLLIVEYRKSEVKREANPNIVFLIALKLLEYRNANLIR